MLIHKFKRAGVVMYKQLPIRKSLHKQVIEIKIASHKTMVSGNITNMEWWAYNDSLGGLRAFIVGCYKCGIDIKSKNFEDSIIYAHGLIVREARL